MDDPFEWLRSLAQLGVTDWDERAMSHKELRFFFKESHPWLKVACLCWGGAHVEPPPQEDYYHVLFEAEAAFDGVRHIWFANQDKEMLGYMNYPNIEDLREGLAALAKESAAYVAKRAAATKGA